MPSGFVNVSGSPASPHRCAATGRPPQYRSLPCRTLARGRQRCALLQRDIPPRLQRRDRRAAPRARDSAGRTLARPAQQVDGEDRTATHGVDVGQRVRGRDATPVVGVIDDRREEVDRAEHGHPVAVEADRGRVVTRIESDQQQSRWTRRQGPAIISSSSPGGILQAHPPPWAYSVRRTARIFRNSGLADRDDAVAIPLPSSRRRLGAWWPS